MTNKKKAIKRANKNKDWEVTEDDIKYRIDTSYWVTAKRGTVAYNDLAPISYGYDEEKISKEVSTKEEAMRYSNMTSVKVERITRYIFDVEQGTRECFSGVTQIN